MKKLFCCILLFFAISSVDSFSQNYSNEKYKKDDHHNYLYEVPGFSHLIQYGQYFGMDDHRYNKFKLDYIFTFRVNEYISVGPAAAVEFYPDLTDFIRVPIYLNIAGNFAKEMYAPYVNFGSGYNIGMGYFYKIGAGLNIASQRSRYILNLGLQLDINQINDNAYNESLGVVVGLNF